MELLVESRVTHLTDNFLLVTTIVILVAAFIFCIGLLLAHASLRKVKPDASFSIRKYCLLFVGFSFAYALFFNEVPYVAVAAAIEIPIIMIIGLWSIYVYRRFVAK